MLFKPTHKRMLFKYVFIDMLFTHNAKNSILFNHRQNAIYWETIKCYTNILSELVCWSNCKQIKGDILGEKKH